MANKERDCIFCKIAEGEAECHKIYEDDFVIAFLDTNPLCYGHTLVVPKKHYRSVAVCDDVMLEHVIAACKKIGNHYVENCGFEGYNIVNACEKAAGQTVFHVHFHIFPRKSGDGMGFTPAEVEKNLKLSKVEKALKLPVSRGKKYSDKKAVIVYTDGACSGNPGPGGWAAILTYKGEEKVICGGEKETTNNRMELYAVIMALEAVKENVPVKLYSDSAYVVNAFAKNWIELWKKTNWKNSSGDPVANRDLWERLLAVMEKLDVEFMKVKGHADSEYNNRCDALARDQSKKAAGN